jgi:hypothetical protein
VGVTAAGAGVWLVWWRAGSGRYVCGSCMTCLTCALYMSIVGEDTPMTAVKTHSACSHCCTTACCCTTATLPCGLTVHPYCHHLHSHTVPATPCHRFDQLRRTSPEQASALAKHIHGMDEVAAAIQSQYMSVQAVMQPQLAAPAVAAPAAPAPLAYTAPLGNGTLAAAPVPASAPFSQTIPAGGTTRPSPRSPVPAAVPAPVGKPAPIAKPNAKPTPTPVPAAT